MPKKYHFFISATIALLVFSLSGCSNNSNDSKSSKSQKEVKAQFVKKASEVCDDMDSEKFAFLYASVGDINAEDYEELLAVAEDELDRIISKFEDIEVPEEHQDYWETFLDDFAAIRNIFPQASTARDDVALASDKLMSAQDPAIIQELQDELDDAQEALLAISENMEKRSDAISENAEQLNIGKCEI